MSKDEKISRLEKDMALLERKIDKKFDRTDESFGIFKSAMIRMQEENASLRKDRDYLLESYSKLLDRLHDSALSDGLRSAVDTMRGSLKDNFETIREAAKEGVIPSNTNETKSRQKNASLKKIKS